MILISIIFISCKEKSNSSEKIFNFTSRFYSKNIYPVYPNAKPDEIYARVGIYIFSQIYGWDPKNKMIYTYYTEENIVNVKTFYERYLSQRFDCKIIDNKIFKKIYWQLFHGLELPNFEGLYEHCSGENMDLISPVYHYGKWRWQSGTMIVFHIEKTL